MSSEWRDESPESDDIGFSEESSESNDEAWNGFSSQPDILKEQVAAEPANDLIQRQELEAAILRLVRDAPSEFPSAETISDVLRRAAQRCRERAAQGPPELSSLDVSSTLGREYTWEDLVAGTNLPEPYYNPEDPVIQLDESQLIPAEAFEVRIEESFQESTSLKTPEPPRQLAGSKKKGKQGQ
jgi:hypothetical protein